MMKNKLLVLFTVLTLIISSAAAVEESSDIISQNSAANEQEQVVQEGVSEDIQTLVSNEGLTPKEEDAQALDSDKPFKTPISKKQIIKKFLFAMLGVVLSSMILFVMLSVYNRIREGFINRVKTPEGETSLETPSDLTSAVKTFLDKTDWN